jgi:hypothetical protein
VSEAAAKTRNVTTQDAPQIRDMLVIGLMWCLSATIVNPIGEFSIIDDWLYESIVKHLLDTGEYPNPQPATMTLVTNVMWGALFCVPAGVSFTALRFSTLIVSLMGLLGTYTLVRELQQPRWLALLITLTVAFNPAYYALSHSFMTDVPFTAIAIWSAVFFARSLRSGSDRHLLSGTILALVATLSRQIGLTIPLAFALTLIVRRGLTWRSILRAGGPITICLGGILAFNGFLAASGRLPATYDLFDKMMMNTLLHIKTGAMVLLSNAYSALIHLGLFLLPILCATGDLSRLRGRRVIALICVGMAMVVLGAGARAHFGLSLLLPLSESQFLVESGIGQLWLRGAEYVPSLPAGFWILVTVMGLLGTVLLMAEVSLYVPAAARQLRHRNLRGDMEMSALFLVICGIAFMLPFLAVVSTDRYLVPCLPFLAAGMVGLSGSFDDARFEASKPLRIAAFLVLAGFGLFAIAGTRDYLAWHRISSEASRDLMQRDRIPAVNIDGGYEFDALYPAQPSREEILTSVDEFFRGNTIFIDTGDVRKQFELVLAPYWRSPSVEYVIGFGPVQGYTVVREYAYCNWMPFHVQKILALRKQ